ncbi:hypothetical protein D1953_07070 [Peribacillus asahii]|uniref:Uncharacterized protein n=1 Tax=Peribacillus asahii TaxID=228899 RepID=A0A398BC98_9BACI|nr:hypothetical protein [Peribacillus asahii]RID87071.1 hypothetical protein D1953_07070 [Peribacillus asahii]
MSKNNEVQIVEDVKEEMQNWMLEQQLTNMENTLSDTISFFSTTFAIVGIGVTILLVFAGWWLNRLFNTKLEKVQEFSNSVSENKTDIEKIEKELIKRLGHIKELENSLREETGKLTNQEEINSFLEKENNYLKEQVEFTLTLTRFQSVILRIEEHLTKINESMIESSEWGSESETPVEDFEWQKKDYLEAKAIYEHFNDTEYHLADYLGDLEAEEQGDRLEELQEKLKSAQEFYYLLLSILEK